MKDYSTTQGYRNRTLQYSNNIIETTAITIVMIIIKIVMMTMMIIGIDYHLVIVKWSIMKKYERYL